jgi:hypothetical protein
MPVTRAAGHATIPHMPPIIAHLGHWYEVTPYMGPVLLVFIWVAVQSRRNVGDDE